MKTVSGKVESKSRAGTGVKVNGDWYNGETDILVNVKWKDDVTMEVDDKGKIISVEVNGGGASSDSNSNGAAKSGGKRPVSGGFNDPARQEVIVAQSARNAAMDLFKCLIETEAVKLPSKQADKYGAAMAFINEHTVIFHRQAMEVYNGKAIDEVLEVE